jgi:hypothetical protein
MQCFWTESVVVHVLQRVLVRNPEGTGSLGRLGVDGESIVKRFLKKWDQMVWSGFFWLKTGTGDGLL